MPQVGLAEMKNVVELSGGLVIQTDSFGNSVFKESFRNLLSGPEESRSVSLASNAIFEVCRACLETIALPRSPSQLGCRTSDCSLGTLYTRQHRHEVLCCSLLSRCGCASVSASMRTLQASSQRTC